MRLVRALSFFALASIACGSSKKLQDDMDSGPPPGDDGSVMITTDAGQDTSMSCATGAYEATQAPTALLTLMQRSGSMSQNNKWAFAAQAIVGALDQPVFDSMSLGFMAAPSSLVTGPKCVYFTSVACGVPAFPQVDIKPAGKNKSADASGVRHDIKNWLTVNAPDQSAGDGNPLYDAIQSGIGALQLASGVQKRILFVITDGAISCASLSKRMGYVDGNGAPTGSTRRASSRSCRRRTRT